MTDSVGILVFFSLPFFWRKVDAFFSSIVIVGCMGSHWCAELRIIPAYIKFARCNQKEYTIVAFVSKLHTLKSFGGSFELDNYE